VLTLGLVLVDRRVLLAAGTATKSSPDYGFLWVILAVLLLVAAFQRHNLIRLYIWITRYSPVRGDQSLLDTSCRACGAELRVDASFCHRCGTGVLSSDESPADLDRSSLATTPSSSPRSPEVLRISAKRAQRRAFRKVRPMDIALSLTFGGIIYVTILQLTYSPPLAMTAAVFAAPLELVLTRGSGYVVDLISGLLLTNSSKSAARVEPSNSAAQLQAGVATGGPSGPARSKGSATPAGRSVAIVVAMALVAAGGGVWWFRRPTRSVEAFCKTYFSERSSYLKRYDNAQQQNGLGSLLTVTAAIGDVPEIFDKLDKVAPDNIEPDVSAVSASLHKSIDALGGTASDPLQALSAGIVQSLLAAGPWQRVSDYVNTNCLHGEGARPGTGTGLRENGMSSSPSASSFASSFGNDSGLVFCSGAEIDLYGMGGQIEDRLELPSTADVNGPQLVSGCSGSSPMDRDLFDKNFSRVVGTLSGTDGSSHVGYFSFADGSFNDVSPPTGSSFSSAPANDTQPMFDPARNELWFLRGDHYVSRNLDTGKESSQSDVPTDDLRFDDSGRPYFAGWIPNPSGTLFVLNTMQTQVADVADIVTRNGEDFDLHVRTLDNSDGSEWGCEPIGWRDDSDFVCFMPYPGANAGLALAHVNWGPGTPDAFAPVRHLSATVTRLLPPSSRTNDCYTLDPARKHFLFRSVEGQTTAWYEGSLDSPSAEPVKLGELPASEGCPIAWI